MSQTRPGSMYWLLVAPVLPLLEIAAFVGCFYGGGGIAGAFVALPFMTIVDAALLACVGGVPKLPAGAQLAWALCGSLAATAIAIVLGSTAFSVFLAAW